jgi:hypothetical protein
MFDYDIPIDPYELEDALDVEHRRLFRLLTGI